MSITISIVIPNYNGESFLSACLCSVFSQITSDCEVVLVDDGSTDKSVDLIRRDFADVLKSGQLTLICTENSGPGAARNIGVKSARGEYVGFLDSDDFILPGYLSRTIAILRNSSPDILQFNLLRVLDDDLRGKHLVACHRSPDGLYDMNSVRNEIYGVGKWFPPARIFKRRIMLAYPFPLDRSFYEDLQLLPFIFLKDFTIFLLAEPLVAYRNNPHGTTRNHKPEHAKTMLALFDRLSSLAPSVPRDLTRVQVARSIVFLVLEMKLREVELWSLLRKVRIFENRASLLAHLGRADRLFLRFPLIYLFLDFCRKKFEVLKFRFNFLARHNL